MLIINSDDWGGWPAATDSALACFKDGRITSVSAMVFMEDSARAAQLAMDAGLDAGLHANFTQPFSGGSVPAAVVRAHDRVRRFLTRNRFAQVMYNPLLRRDFSLVYQAQEGEFRRLYGREPSHVDGHRHMHLCSNMLLNGVIGRGQRVRRSFSFWSGEKSALNRAYRRLVDWWLSRRYRMTDYFFALSQHLEPTRLRRIADLSKNHNVELMTHAENALEHSLLMSTDFERMLKGIRTAAYLEL